MRAGKCRKIRRLITAKSRNLHAGTRCFMQIARNPKIRSIYNSLFLKGLFADFDLAQCLQQSC